MHRNHRLRLKSANHLGSHRRINSGYPTYRKKEHIHISAHVLRHTFLRKAARKYGVEYAKELAGHTSDRYIWRYVQPSDAEKEEAVDNLF